MAKRIVKWTLDGNVLKLAKAVEDEKSVAVVEAEFDLTKIFPGFTEMTEVQKQLVVYGTKQKLMDVGAGEVRDADGKVRMAKSKFAELVEGKWTGERVNGTGAAENRKVMASLKETIKVVSLEGLVVKKTLYPATFTPEDQEKLDELMAAAVKASKASKK